MIENDSFFVSIRIKKNPTPLSRCGIIYMMRIVAIVLVQPLNVAEVLTMWQLIVLRIHTNTGLE